MTLSGFLIMLASVGSVTGLFAWCIYKVLTGRRPPEDFHAIEPIEEDQIDQR